MPVTSSDLWDADAADRYDLDEVDMFVPDVLGPTVEFLAARADGGPALELAIGTGRVAIALGERGMHLVGIELSEPMADQVRRKVGDRIPVTIGDMATSEVEGEFGLVYLVFNTIGNLRTQEEQVACFANAARHLRPGGRFVVEVWVPPLRRLPQCQSAVPFDVSEKHVGFDTMDLVTQQAQLHLATRRPAHATTMPPS